MFEHFYHPDLKVTSPRLRTNGSADGYKLDKNEHPLDIDRALKTEVLQNLSNTEWNRYPSMDYKDLEKNLSEFCQLSENEVVLAPGAASIIAALLNYFAINNFEINIVQPSYAFFNHHCNAYNIPYRAWWLNDELEYDLKNLPKLHQNSVLVLASPNNPTGNVLSINELSEILKSNAESFVVLDAVYQEYGEIDYSPLIKEFGNLILIRSFSKAIPAAGLRLGYACAQPELAGLLRKLIMPYSINPFALQFAKTLLTNKKYLRREQVKINQILFTREVYTEKLTNRFNNSELVVKPSHGNFILIKIINDNYFNEVMQQFSSKKINVLDTSRLKGLNNTFRLSVGQDYEMETVFNCLQNVIH